jgi:hypothetical protein
MRSTFRGVGVALVAVVLVTSAACGDDDEDDAGDTTSDTTEGTGGEVEGVAVTTVDFAFQDLPELRSGVNELTITNDGAVSHEFAVLQLDEATSIEDFAAAMPAVLEGGPFPDAVGSGSGSPEVAAGSSLTFSFTLPEPGRYAAFCLLTGDPELAEDEQGEAHISRGMVAEVEVEEGDSGATIEGTDGTITAIDYDFQTDVSAGDTTITFVNDGPQEFHFAGLSVFPEGTTPEQAETAFQALLELPEDQPPPEGTVFPEDVAASAVSGPGSSSTFEVPGGFESGRTYLAVCFISDRAGGPPHAIANQMFHAFTVE